MQATFFEDVRRVSKAAEKNSYQIILILTDQTGAPLYVCFLPIIFQKMLF